MRIKVFKDHETSEHAGAGGMFQIMGIEDEQGNDFTRRIDVGIHFHDDDELRLYLAGIFSVPIEELEFEKD